MLGVLSMGLTFMIDSLLEEIYLILSKCLVRFILISFTKGLNLSELLDIFFVGKNLVLKEIYFLLNVKITSI